MYIPPQQAEDNANDVYSPPVHTTPSLSTNYQYQIPYNQGSTEYADYQELEIITAPTVKSKASVYGGQHTFDVKVSEIETKIQPVY